MFNTNAIRNSLITFCAVTLFILCGCAANAPKRMLTGTAERQDSTTSTTFSELIPTPGHVFSTSESSTITALLVAECRVSSSADRIEVRIKVDDQIADPGVAVLTTNSKYETRSHLAFKTQVPPGQHKVTVEWRVSGGQGFVRNRSFTVWEVR